MVRGVGGAARMTVGVGVGCVGTGCIGAECVSVGRVSVGEGGAGASSGGATTADVCVGVCDPLELELEELGRGFLPRLRMTALKPPSSSESPAEEAEGHGVSRSGEEYFDLLAALWPSRKVNLACTESSSALSDMTRSKSWCRSRSIIVGCEAVEES